MTLPGALADWNKLTLNGRGDVLKNLAPGFVPAEHLKIWLWVFLKPWIDPGLCEMSETETRTSPPSLKFANISMESSISILERQMLYKWHFSSDIQTPPFLAWSGRIADLHGEEEFTKEKS